MQPNTIAPHIAQVLSELLKATGEGLALIQPGAPNREILALGLGDREVLASVGPMLPAASRLPQHGMSPIGRPVLAAPIYRADAPVMVIALWRSPGSKPWTASDHLLITAVAAMISPLLPQTGAFDVQNADQFDHLTRLPAYGWFRTELARRIERANHDQDVSTLMLVDIDGLERLNVNAGRPIGDRILLRAAAGLRRMTRPGDLLARVGGDEFALWLTGMDHLAAAERAENIRRDLLAPQPDDEINLKVTVTIGIATRWPAGNETAEGLIARAQGVMRQVKAEGGAAWRVAPEWSA